MGDKRKAMDGASLDSETAASSRKSPVAHHHSPSPSDRATGDASVAILSLPRGVMELVFSFALKDIAVELRPVKRKGWRRLARPKVPIEALAVWRPVCRDWDTMIRDIIARSRTRTVKANLSHKTEQQQTEIVQSIVSRGDAVVDLRIALFGHQNHRVVRRQSVDWGELLRHCPNLQRLDVSKMTFLTRERLVELLDAAARYCLKLQVLLLPLPLGWSKYPEPNDEGDDGLIEALARALEQWLRRGPSGGLRQLMVPHLARNSNDFIAAVARFAPKVELLDGWKLTYLNDGWGALTCDDEWHLSLDVWEAFCQNCADIREFNWVVVPFADAFFIPFGSTVKWRLTDLSLDFTDAFDALDDAVGPAYSADGLCLMLRGVPYVKRFKVTLHPRCRVDVNIFGDKFLIELARSASYLEQFSIIEAGQYSGSDAIESISNDGISQLAAMPHLADITLEAIQTGSCCDFSVLVSKLPLNLRQRNVKIGILEDFGDCVLPLVQHIVEQPEGTFDGRAFAILLVNQGYRRGKVKVPSSPHTWEQNLGEVQAALQAKHPTVRFQLTLEKQKMPRGSAASLYCVSKFSVFTTSWVYPDVMGGTFYRGDIVYQANEDKVSFAWIKTFG